MKVLELIDMCKYKKGVTIFENVSITVLQSQCYGIIGKDDAGKTSIIDSLLGLSKYDSGNVKFCENKLKKDDFSQIGYIPDDLLGFENITGIKLIDMLLEMKKNPVDLDYVQELIDFFEIDICQNVEYMDENTNKCLYIISILMYKPKLLILDEPFNFLDKEHSQKLRSYISEYKKSGNSIILLSDNYDDIKDIADQFTYLYEGKQLLRDEEVKNFREKIIITIKGFNSEEFKKILTLWLKMEPKDAMFLRSIYVFECDDGTLKFIVKNDITYIKRIIMSIRCNEFTVNKLTPEELILNNKYKNIKSLWEEFF